MRNSEINELCRRIYQKHRRALDLIYELRPDRQAMIGALLENLIQQVPGLVLDTSTKTYIRFALKEWDVPLLLEGNGWTPSGRILLFQFDNDKESLKINLYIGPGPQQTRQKLFDMAKQPPFSIARRALTNKWSAIYQLSFLTPQSYEDTSDNELETEIRKHWAAFLENDLPKLDAVIQAQEWIWQPTNNPVNVIDGYDK